MNLFLNMNMLIYVAEGKTSLFCPLPTYKLHVSRPHILVFPVTSDYPCENIILQSAVVKKLLQLSWLIIVLASRLHARNFNGVSMLCTDPRTIPYNAHHLCISFGLGQRVCGRLDLILSWNGNYWCATEEYIS